ncbi:MAG: shikimate kinase [Elusimicrobia bacterium]|nr:shikimate kinase [Elusimicrobiota bacterium]
MPKKLNKIFIVGFMCSGKTTIGRLLAERLNLKFKDSDAEIEEIYRKSPSDIIKKQGLGYFRKIEEKTVKELIKDQNIVIAMGGGIMASKKWPEYLRNKGLSVYLSCAAHELKKRLLKAKNARPLIGGGNSKKVGERIKKLLAKRRRYYRKADLKLSVTKLSPVKAVKKIKKLINSYAKEI